jgi:hypothetical protein
VARAAGARRAARRARVWGLAQAMRQQEIFEILLIELQPV